MVCGGVENKSVEVAELVRVREVACSKKFEYFGVSGSGWGKNSDVTTDRSIMFTECQSQFCCSNC